MTAAVFWKFLASGSALIAGIALFRALFLRRLPKRVFVAAWELAILRLLIPVNIALPILPAEGYAPPREGVATAEEFVPENADLPYDYPDYSPAGTSAEAGEAYENSGNAPGSPASEKSVKRSFPWVAVWAFGAAAMGIYYVVSYVYTLKKLRTALPVENSYVKDWLFVYRLERRVSVKYSDRVNSPLTYGVFNPVIVLPKDLSMCDENALGYILEHEFAHVKHLDALKKPVAAAVLCLNWFNPLVWALYSMYNRDIELWCDECVLKRCGGQKARSAYAMTIISMEELRGHSALVSAFRKNSVEERIVSIMKFKKLTFITAIAAALIIAAVSISVFAASVEPVPKKPDGDSLPVSDDGAAEPETLPENGTHLTDAKAYGESGEKTDGDSFAEFTISGNASLQQIHNVYENGEKGWDYLNLEEGERAAVICDFKRTPTDDEVASLSANGLYNGESFYKTEKSVAVGTRVVCLFVAPKAGNYSFSINYNGGGSVNFTAGAYAENSGEPYKFGEIELSESDFDGATVTKIDPMRTETDGENSAAVRVYTNSQGESYYEIITSNGCTERCAALKAETAAKLGLDGIALQDTVIISGDEFDKWLTGDAESLKEGAKCYDVNLGYITLSDAVEEYNPEKEYMSEEEYYASVESSKGSLYRSLIETADKMPQGDITLKITRYSIPDPGKFAPGDMIKISDIRNVEGSGAVINPDGSCHLEKGICDIQWAFDGLDKSLDYRVPVEVGYIKDGRETVLTVNEEIRSSAFSYVPGPFSLIVRVAEEGDYTFYIKNAGDTELKVINERVVCYGRDSEGEGEMLEVR